MNNEYIYQQIFLRRLKKNHWHHFTSFSHVFLRIIRKGTIDQEDKVHEIDFTLFYLFLAKTTLIFFLMLIIWKTDFHCTMTTFCISNQKGAGLAPLQKPQPLLPYAWPRNWPRSLCCSLTDFLIHLGSIVTCFSLALGGGEDACRRLLTTVPSLLWLRVWGWAGKVTASMSCRSRRCWLERWTSWVILQPDWPGHYIAHRDDDGIAAVEDEQLVEGVESLSLQPCRPWTWWHLSSLDTFRCHFTGYEGSRPSSFLMMRWTSPLREVAYFTPHMGLTDHHQGWLQPETCARELPPEQPLYI